MPPRRCFPMGSSEAGFLRAFLTAALCAAPPFPFVLLSPPPGAAPLSPLPDCPDNDAARAHSRSRKPAGSPFPFPLFPDSRHALPGGGHARLIPPAPARGCSRRISPSISVAPVSSVPRRLVPCRRALYPALFLCGRTHRAVFSLFHTRAARLSFPALPARPSCASRRGDGRSASPARPACVETTRSKSPARQRIPRAPGLCARRARPGRPCRRAPPFASVRIPPCRRAPFFSIARQESERERRILYEHMFV